MLNKVRKCVMSQKMRNKGSLISILLNVLAILGGIFYILINQYIFIWDIYGIILLITVYWNLFFTFIILKQGNKNHKLGKKLHLFGIFYFIFIIFAMEFILMSNLLISIKYSNDNFLLYNLIYGFFFLHYILGLGIGFFTFKAKNRSKLWNPRDSSQNKTKSRGNENPNKPISIIKKILTFYLFLGFIAGVYIGFAAVFGLFFDIFVISTIMAGQFGIFLSFIFLGNLFLLLKMNWVRKNTKRYKIIGILGILSSSFLIVPLIAMPSAQTIAKKNFSDAFGDEWQQKIPDESEINYFLETPFTIPQYFLGVPPKDCKIGKDITFYEDNDLKLKYDVYIPKLNPDNLPGEGSVLIRLHGGGWDINDKGAGNMLQMNKYFSAQGYIVFDVQYAQYDIGFNLPNTPEYLLGDYSIDDIVKSLGYFTKFLANNSEEYDGDNSSQEPNLNLDSVFISGGSAGGQLTCALGWGITSGQYTEIFGTNLTIKGIIPFYPANGMMKWFNIEVEDNDLGNPERLIDKKSPPCLIYQGTHDILNWFHIAEGIKEKYTEVGRKDCAIIWLPGGGHASDIYFNGYYNLLFLYYMERFMYLYK